VSGAWSGPSFEGLDENIVIVEGVSPDDLCNLVCPSLGAFRQRMAIESSHAPYLIFSEMELDGVSKFMAKDRLDSFRASPEQLGGNDDFDVPLSCIVVTISAEGHIATFWEPFGLSHDKRNGEVRPNDALDIAVQSSVHSLGVFMVHWTLATAAECGAISAIPKPQVPGASTTGLPVNALGPQSGWQVGEKG